MALADEKEGDGKGGWTDQGPATDGAHFASQLTQTDFKGIPFQINPNGKCVLALLSDAHFPKGVPSAELPVAHAEKYRCLYLMHAVAWGGDIGNVIITDTKGKTHTIKVSRANDVADWCNGNAQLKNAFPAVVAWSPSRGETSLFISRYQIPDELGPIAKVRLESARQAIWLVLGASLTQEDIPLPLMKPLVIEENDEWKPARYRYDTRTEKGSVLDRTPYNLGKTVDQLGRIIVRDGHFWYEKEPQRRAVFQVNAVHPSQMFQFDHKMVEELVDETARNGYNMIRPHFLDSALMLRQKEPLAFNEKILDNFDYMVHLCRQRGIYIMFDAMTSWLGYNPGDIWSKKSRDWLISYKWRIAIDPDVRENWSKGVEKILRHQNKYTGLCLAEDPVMAMAIAYNEEEFGFQRPFVEEAMAPHWHRFLEKKYRKISALNRAWGTKFAKFDEVPVWKPSQYGGVSGNDAALCAFELESNLMTWYTSELRRFGYPGAVTGFNCGKSMYYHLLRHDSDFIAMNNYASHPSGNRITQASPIGSSLTYARQFAATRYVGKPFVISEHNVVFWNKYRYEQAFGTGAFSAFQDFEAVTVHAEPINLQNRDAWSFRISKDPVMRACEFLTYFLFVRRDVQPTRSFVRVRAREEDVFVPNGMKGGMPSEQSLAALVSGLSVECVPRGGKSVPLRKNELLLNLDKSAAVTIGEGFMEVKDSATASAAAVIAELKRRGYIPKNNRSDGTHIFESDTGELYLDAEKKFMRVNTPRFQGVCATAGTTFKLPELQIHQMTLDGNLALVSVDGYQPLRKARRMALVYATNALNTGMTFNSDSMTVVEKSGTQPALVQCGQFEVTIENENAARLGLYPLDFAGHRLKRLAPVSVQGNAARFAVDMCKDGQAFFYELSVE